MKKKKSCIGGNTEDSYMFILFILAISGFKKCPHSVGPKRGSWMWSCSIPTGAEDDPLQYLPQVPECCEAGHEHSCWELAAFSSLNSSFWIYSPLVHLHVI